MKKGAYILIIFGFVSVLFGCVNKEKAINRKVKILEEEAGLALKTKNYTLAEEKLEAILKITPDSEYIKNNLAVLCAQYSNKPEKAIKLWQEIIEKDPKNAAYYNNIAGLYWQKGESDKALEYYRNATKYHPSYHMPYFNMAQIYLEKADYIAAEKAAAKGFEFAKTDSRMLKIYAKTLLFNNKRDRSRVVLEEAYNRSPKVLLVNLDYSRILLGVHEYKKAAEVINASLGEYPMNPILLAELVEVELARKTDKAEVDKIFQQITASEAKIFEPWLKEFYTIRAKLKNEQNQELLNKLNKLAGKIPPAFGYYEGLRLWETAKLMKELDASANVTEIMRRAFFLCPERVPFSGEQKEK